MAFIVELVSENSHLSILFGLGHLQPTFYIGENWIKITAVIG